MAQPVTPEDFLERAREHFERRRFLNTLESLRVTLQMVEDRDARTYKTKLDAEVLAAESLAALGRQEEAANMYERAVTHGYKDKKVDAFLAIYFDTHKKWDKALEYFEKYYASDKADVVTHIRYATLLGRLKNREKARQILEGTEPALTSRKNEECEKLEQRKKLRDATTCFRALRDARPEKDQHYLALYRLAAAQREPKPVKESAEALYFIFGDQPRYIWPLIELKLAQKKFYDARLLLEEVIALNGQDGDAERLLTNLQNDAGPAALEKPHRASRKEMKMLGGKLQ